MAANMKITVFWGVATRCGPTFQRCVLPPSPALMIQAVYTSETLRHLESTQHHIPGGSYIQEQTVFG
jgi:hypothetical protein